MAEHQIERASTTEGLPVTASLGPILEQAGVPTQLSLVDRRVVFLCALSILIAIAAAFIAEGLMHLIAMVTHLSFYGQLSADFNARFRYGSASSYLPSRAASLPRPRSEWILQVSSSP